MRACEETIDIAKAFLALDSLKRSALREKGRGVSCFLIPCGSSDECDMTHYKILTREKVCFDYIEVGNTRYIVIWDILLGQVDQLQREVGDKLIVIPGNIDKIPLTVLYIKDYAYRTRG